MVKKLLAAVILFSGFTARAQDLPLHSLHWNYLTQYNPASAGKSEKFNIAIPTRKQWAGMDGSPFTSAFMTDFLLKKYNTGIGFITDLQTQDYYQNIYTRWQASYRIKMKEKMLNIGLEPGFTNIKINEDEWRATLPSGSDSIVPAKETGFQLSGGFMLYSEKFYLGFSARQLYATKFKNINLQPDPYYMLQGGFDVKSSEKWTISPYVLLSYANENLNAIGNFTMTYKEKFEMGGGYRTDESVILSAAYKGKIIKLGYSYDLSVSGIEEEKQGSHEVFFRLALGKKDK